MSSFFSQIDQTLCLLKIPYHLLPIQFVFDLAQAKASLPVLLEGSRIMACAFAPSGMFAKAIVSALKRLIGVKYKTLINGIH